MRCRDVDGLRGRGRGNRASGRRRYADADVVASQQGRTGAAHGWVPGVEVSESDSLGRGYVTTAVPRCDEQEFVAVGRYTALHGRRCGNGSTSRRRGSRRRRRS